jgi:hypothetical protein
MMNIGAPKAGKRRTFAEVKKGTTKGIRMHDNFKERGMFQLHIHMHDPDETCEMKREPVVIRSTRKMDKQEEERLCKAIGTGSFLEIKYPYENCTDPKRGTHQYPTEGEWFTGVH